MKKYLALIPIVLMTTLPPIGIAIPITDNPAWRWFVMISIFLGLYTFCLRIPSFLKAFIAIAVGNILVSSIPFVSQWAFIQMIGCVYLYILWTTVKDWQPLFNSIWVLLGITIIFLLAQYFHKDSLLNFGLSYNTCNGTIGNLMQLKSFVILLCAVALQDKRLNFLEDVRYVIAIIILLMVVVVSFILRHNITGKLMAARIPYWIDTIKIGLQKPWFGWGLGTYKVIFPAMIKGGWLMAHNFLAQIFMETGAAGATAMIGLGMELFIKIRRNKRLMIGAALILYSLIFHFPDREPGCVPLLILFIAYIDRGKHVEV